MADAAEQKSLVVWSGQKASRDGGDAKLHIQTQDTSFQESATQKERQIALQESQSGNWRRVVDSCCNY